MARAVTLDDETLRDGLQNPSVHDPSIAEKIEILHLMESLGIESVNIGLPGAGPRAFADTEALAQEIVRRETENQAELRRANPCARYSAYRGNFAKSWNLHRSGHVSWVPARFAGWSKIGTWIICSA